MMLEKAEKFGLDGGFCLVLRNRVDLHVIIHHMLISVVAQEN